MKRLAGILLWISISLVTQAQDSIMVSLAEWTFDRWYGGGVLPPGQTEFISSG